MLWISRDKRDIHNWDHIKLWADEPELDVYGEFGILGSRRRCDNYIYYWHDDELMKNFGIKIEKGHKKRINMTEI